MFVHRNNKSRPLITAGGFEVYQLSPTLLFDKFPKNMFIATNDIHNVYPLTETGHIKFI